MCALTETDNHIRTTMTLALSVQNGSLIDFETTGIPYRDSDMEIVTLGYFNQNQVVIIQRKTTDKKLFYDEIQTIIRDLPKPFYSYNTRFESDVISSELGIKLGSNDFIDLMDRWKKKADGQGLKWPKLDELISEPEDYFQETKIGGKDIPGLWKAFLSGGTETLLKLIMQHCLSDLLRETILLFRYNSSS